VFGVDFGPSSGEIGASTALTGESAFGQATGEGLIGNSSALINGLLSGNQEDISKLLAPQISGVAKNANEKTQTNTQFGNRSGGTNASNQNTMDTARSSVNDMISKLTSGAIDTSLSTGTNLLNSSISGNENVFAEDTQEQNQRASRVNDIVGSSTAVASAFGF
jgi:hypothetical protein